VLGVGDDVEVGGYDSILLVADDLRLRRRENVDDGTGEEDSDLEAFGDVGVGGCFGFGHGRDG